VSAKVVSGQDPTQPLLCKYLVAIHSVQTVFEVQALQSVPQAVHYQTAPV
jgi:hypothetical protein